MRPYDPDDRDFTASHASSSNTGMDDMADGTTGTTPGYIPSSAFDTQGADYAYNSSLDMADNIEADMGTTPRLEMADSDMTGYDDAGVGMTGSDSATATSLTGVYPATSQVSSVPEGSRGSDDDAEDAAKDDGVTDETELIRADIEQTRSQMSSTIDQIQERLNPQNLVDQAKDAVREATIGRVENVVNDVKDTARDAGSGILDTIKENPLPAALAAVGLGWLFMKGRNNPRNNRYDRYAPDSVYRYGPYGPAYGAGYPPNYGPGYGQGYGPGYGAAPDMNYNRGGSGGPGEMIGKAGEKIGDAASNVGRAVGDTAGNVGSTIGDVAGGAAGAVGSAAGAVGGAVGSAAGAVGEAAGNIAGTVGDKVGDLGSGVQYGAQRAQSQLQRMIYQNPLAVGGAAMLVGAALGMMLPETEQEHRLLGEARDTVVDKAQAVAQQTMDKVSRVADDVAGTVQETVQEAAGTVKDTVKDAAENQGLTGSAKGSKPDYSI